MKAENLFHFGEILSVYFDNVITKRQPHTLTDARLREQIGNSQESAIATFTIS